MLKNFLIFFIFRVEGNTLTSGIELIRIELIIIIIYKRHKIYKRCLRTNILKIKFKIIIIIQPYTTLKNRIRKNRYSRKIRRK